MHPTWPRREEAAALAERLSPLLRFGTSTWNYPGWRGLIYHKDYPAKGDVSRMLPEYASWPLFWTVGIDSFHYRPPSAATLRRYGAALPPGFACVSKVWERITVHTFVEPRGMGPAGERNPDWLHAELYRNEVLGPMVEHFGDHLGPQVFEFQAIGAGARMSAGAFATHLDRFFSSLPTTVPYAVEIRNPEFLAPEYFAVLREHGVAHVFNSWSRMPTIGEQLLLHESLTAGFLVMRALNRPGRSFQEAVDAFAPYTHVQDPNPGLRADIAALARTALELRIPAWLIVGNRAEGNSPTTIAAVAALLAGDMGLAQPAGKA